LPAPCPVNTCTSGDLGGLVFNDFNVYRIQQAGETFCTDGITITLLDFIGNNFSTTSNINGILTIANPSTFPIRVEFSNLPA
jgi:hypothetical protein